MQMWQKEEIHCFQNKSPEERKELIANKKFFICGEEGHQFYQCPLKNSRTKDEPKAKKPKPTARLVLDSVRDQRGHSKIFYCNYSYQLGSLGFMFYIMTLDGSDVLLGMPWCHQV